MEEVIVLHLSDLHINTDTGTNSNLLTQLLNDIRDQIQSFRNIIVVVTGDIIDRGQYKNIRNVITFFKELKKVIGKKFISIHIVPGNHDKTRKMCDSILVKECLQSDKILDEAYYKENWGYHLIAFQKYNEMLAEIYEIFYKDKEVNKVTYGIEVDRVANKNICFILLNTAWCAIGDNDNRHLRVGEFQLAKLEAEYIRKKNEYISKGENIDLTIALAHHPLEWLAAKEEDMAKAYLIANNSLNVDIFICGHTHQRDTSNWYNHKHSLTTLVTGIGWPDNLREVHPENHRYSIYNFNIELNSIDIFMRSSNDEENFGYDFSAYVHDDNEKISKLVYPIKANKNQTYLKLSTENSDYQKSFFLNQILIEKIKLVMRRIGYFRNVMSHICGQHKHDFINSVLADVTEENKKKLEFLDDYFFDYNLEQEISEELKEIFLAQEELIYSNFDSYLRQICQYFSEEVWGEILECNETVRSHFRYYNKENDCYYKLCSYRLVKKKESTVITGIEDDLLPLQWEGAVEKAYYINRPLVNNIINNNFNTAEGKWSNFITVVPDFEKNNYRKTNRSQRIRTERPYLTFGIACNCTQSNEILYILDYLDIHVIIGEIIDDYLKYFPIDIGEFVSNLGDNA
ncbi:metallophosphoesterase family protein [Anaeromicropila herbilytica]|uniref:Calcineurin-like phosphoesterase domain-containing protein n=1 Tax=Anaeromicropila herbilytica TaxID=2785025 RepID=A0A7R7EPQ0_9FIRM|nr:metallophosphoesterase [Anaeromicropila herbilytica]BCN32450.1 hypothetical protein bsdtb5_37450 [Anaeromicropila herbilytica]